MDDNHETLNVTVVGPEGGEPPDLAARLRAYRRDNRIAAAITLVLSAWAVEKGVEYGLWGNARPGAGLFPFLIATCLTLLSVVWLFKPGEPEIDPADIATADGEDISDQIAQTLPASARLKLALSVAVTAVAIFMFINTGYALTLFIYSVVLLVGVGSQKILPSIVGSAVGVVVSEYLFVLIGVVLPVGPVDTWVLYPPLIHLLQ